MEDVVHYSIPRRPFYKRTMIALEASAKKGNKFTVFQKLKQNQWADLGQFKVAAIHERKDDVIFELVRLDAM